MQLLFQRGGNLVLLSQGRFHVSKVADHAVLLHFVLALVGGEEFADALQARMDFIDRFLRRVVFHLQCRRRLGPLKKDEATVLLMRVQIFFVGRMTLDEVHERQRMIRILDCPAILPQRQPAHAAMIKLQKLPVRFLTLVVAQGKISLGFARQPVLLLQIIEESRMPMRMRAIRPARRFKLQRAEVDAQLDDLSAIVRLHEPGLGDAGLVLPIFQNEIDVLIHYVFLAIRDHGTLVFIIPCPVKLSQCFRTVNTYALPPPGILRNEAIPFCVSAVHVV